MKRSQVRALLRKARVTLECEQHVEMCPFFAAWMNAGGDAGEFVVGFKGHEGFASWCLEGLDVRDVTEAGG